MLKVRYEQLATFKTRLRREFDSLIPDIYTQMKTSNCLCCFIPVFFIFYFGIQDCHLPTMWSSKAQTYTGFLILRLFEVRYHAGLDILINKCRGSPLSWIVMNRV